VAGSCEHGNEPSDYMKGGEFLDYLSDYQRLKDSAPLRELATEQNVRICRTCCL